MIRRLAPLVKSIRSLGQTSAKFREFREGRSIVHGRHQLPYWADKHNKQIKVHELDNGHKIELPKYTVRPFMMQHTEGRQPMSEQAPLWNHRTHPDNPNQHGRTREKGHIKGLRAIQHAGPALLKRTGYIVDSFRLTPKHRKQNIVFKEQVLKIVEDHTMMRHLALVCGAGKPRWIPATKHMKVGQVLVNDGSGELDPEKEPTEGNAHMLKSLQIGTEICMVEEFPGSGSRFACSNNRYGIVTGRIGRDDYESLITVSFPYASTEGIQVDGDFRGKVNYKGVLDDNGIHSRMGGYKNDEIMEDGSIQLSKLPRRENRERPANPRHGPWESYHISMHSHQEHSYDQTPQSFVSGIRHFYNSARSGNCVAVIGRASQGGKFNAQLLSSTPTNFKMFGGEMTNGYISKEMRKCGKLHLSLHYRRFKRPPGHLVNNQGNQFVLLNKGD